MSRSPGLLLPLLALLGSGGTGCDAGQGVYPFSAFPYDPVGHCLGSAVVVDVLSGADPGPCAQVRCWERVSGEVFVTDAACVAPADFTDHSADAEGPCKEALAAYESAGHGRCPAPLGDAGS